MQDDHANQPGYPLPDGTLFVASNPGFDQTWLLSMNTVDLNAVRPSKGWEFAPVSSDPQWTPDACGGVYHALVGTRYEVLADAAPLVPLDPSTVGWDGSDAPIYHGRITIFDLFKRQFSTSAVPNDHTYFRHRRRRHTLDVLYAPEPAGAPTSIASTSVDAPCPASRRPTTFDSSTRIDLPQTFLSPFIELRRTIDLG